MNRRDMTRLMAMSAVAPAFARAAQEPQGRVGFAVVGLGAIAEIFMRACSNSTRCHVTALVSGHIAQKAPKYQGLYHIADSSVYSYDNFDEIARNPDITAVYIALPNSMHAEYTIRAAKAGKHVFCEKPMAISSSECRAMISACRQAGVKLMIGYRTHYDATFQAVRELVRTGRFGDVQSMQGGFYGQKRAGEWRLNRALAGGGSLFDLGIYPLNAMRWLIDDNPSHFRAFTSTREQGTRFAQVEQSIEWIMRFPSGILANCGSSYGQSGPAFLQLNGLKGHVRIDPAFYYGDVKYTYTGVTSDGTISGGSSVTDPDQFVREAEHFGDCVLTDLTPHTPGEDGLADLVAIEQIYKSASLSMG